MHKRFKIYNASRYQVAGKQIDISPFLRREIYFSRFSKASPQFYWKYRDENFTLKLQTMEQMRIYEKWTIKGFWVLKFSRFLSWLIEMDQINEKIVDKLAKVISSRHRNKFLKKWSITSKTLVSWRTTGVAVGPSVALIPIMTSAWYANHRFLL